MEDLVRNNQNDTESIVDSLLEKYITLTEKPNKKD